MTTLKKKPTYKLALEKTIKEFTSLSDSEIEVMVDSIPVASFTKGTLLLSQGDIPIMSYFVIEGCVRQFAIDINGKETTLDFYTENHAINMFSFTDDNGASKYSLECLENSVLVACDDTEDADDSLELLGLKHGIFKNQFTDMQNTFMNFKALTPIERYNNFVKSRPDLIKRVPQNILANYLGITPESFSRFKKRTNQDA